MMVSIRETLKDDTLLSCSSIYQSELLVGPLLTTIISGTREAWTVFFTNQTGPAATIVSGDREPAFKEVFSGMNGMVAVVVDLTAALAGIRAFTAAKMFPSGAKRPSR
jgi:hypothetical protein